MKKILALTLLLVALTLCFSSCQKAAIEISPYGQFPDTYEIVYTEYDSKGQPSGLITAGRDANDNLFYDVTYLDGSSGGEQRVFLRNHSESFVSYREYVLNPETGKFELENDNSSGSRRLFDEFYKAAHNAAVQGSYEKIDALTLPEGSEDDLVFLDAEKFEYYKAIGAYGGTFETAVQKGTGICFYANYESGSTFTVVKYNDSYTGNYADLIPAE